MTTERAPSRQVLGAAALAGAMLLSLTPTTRHALAEPPPGERLMPDWDATRRERLAVGGARFRTPEGFRIEQVASSELVGSVVNLSFDSQGRPIVALEERGLHLLEDRDGDGHFESIVELSTEIETAHGLYVLGPGDLLAHANGPPEGTGLYRIRDWGDTSSLRHTELVMASRGGIQEHGPHTITRGPDGALYTLFGNHSAPDVQAAPSSPLRTLREDQLLPVILDPRGHANSITAPGGTIWRFEPDGAWELLAGGLRNPFDMAFSAEGALFVHEADMEWDRDLPWYRPTRVLHAIPSGDYGWRTGSGKIAFDNADTLPSVVDIGRGSPVGVAFYHHHRYPRRFDGAHFLGDWSRGRIRVLFPEREGATWTGEVQDFVLGEPLNVTDLDVGPDGWLYFTTGGRQTTGGLYRVVWEGAAPPRPEAGSAVDRVLRQAMPRSAWGREALLAARGELGDGWAPALRRAIRDAQRPSLERQRALEALQVYGPPPSADYLASLLEESDAELRAAATLLLGALDSGELRRPLERALADPDPLVRRRSCEALLRSGLLTTAEAPPSSTLEPLVSLLDDPDRFVRYAAREALGRLDPATWSAQLAARPAATVRGDLAAQLALILRPDDPAGHSTAVAALQEIEPDALAAAELGDYLRTVELALVRDPRPETSRQRWQTLGPKLLALYPSDSPSLDRKLERLLAFLAPEGAREALLVRLESLDDQLAEIHLVYALRALEGASSPAQREHLVTWFDRARRMRGAASMSGYIEALWQDVVATLPPDEQHEAEERKQAFQREKAARIEALLAKADKKDSAAATSGPDMSQMSFEELAEFLEYDVMSYERYDPADGEIVFLRARCADCHIFGETGRGGGPDLSTVVSRFRRREILEAIYDPSKVISDQYQAVDIELVDGRFLSGFVTDETDRRLFLITANGERVRVRKARIRSREPSQVSIMPEGLLDAMSFSDLMSLMRFLEEGAE
jgi:putative heme-binding domain-containing protein